MENGIIFDIKRYSIHDGPGIRTTVFFKGCPLSCGWCHNPESRSSEPELAVFHGRCSGCGLCVDACPSDAIDSEHLPGTLRDRCTVCGGCIRICPSRAREMVGRRVNSREVMDILDRDVPFYGESGGGVTFSGGEPLMQHHFLLELLEECRDRKLHTAVDTSCYADERVFLQVAELADIMLCDLKLIDEVQMLRYTGVSAEPVLNNIRSAAEEGADLRFRLPLVPGITDSEDNLSGIADFIASLPLRPLVTLLPYHDTWREKSGRLGASAGGTELSVSGGRDLEDVYAFLTGMGMQCRAEGREL